MPCAVVVSTALARVREPEQFHFSLADFTLPHCGFRVDVLAPVEPSRADRFPFDNACEARLVVRLRNGIKRALVHNSIFVAIERKSTARLVGPLEGNAVVGVRLVGSGAQDLHD